MSLYNIKSFLVSTTGISTFKRIAIDSNTNWWTVKPPENSMLWRQNRTAYIGLIVLAQEFKVIQNPRIFANLLIMMIEEIKNDVSFVVDERHLKMRIALALHYYLLGFFEVADYTGTSSTASFGRGGEKSSAFIAEANIMVLQVSQMLGRNLTHLNFQTH